MGLGDHLTNLKQRVRITVVVPTTRSIQGVLRDGATISVTVWEVPGAFVWPKVNEQWSVNRVSGMWLLGERIEAVDEENSIEDLGPGEGKIDADTVKDRAGRAFISSDVKRLMNFGTVTVSWTGNNDSVATVVDHGLPGTPGQVLLTPRTAGTASAIYAATDRTETTFTISGRGYENVNITQSVSVDWMAVL